MLAQELGEAESAELGCPGQQLCKIYIYIYIKFIRWSEFTEQKYIQLQQSNKKPCVLV